MFFKSSSSWEVCICHYKSKFTTDFKIHKNSCTSGDMQQKLGMCFSSIFILPTHVYTVCMHIVSVCVNGRTKQTNKQKTKNNLSFAKAYTFQAKPGKITCSAES